VRVIVVPPEVVATGHRRKRAVERQDFEAVFGELELPDDFRSQERHHVRTDGIFEAGEDFFGDRGAAHQMATFEHHDLAAGAGEVRGCGQPVVAGANNDGVVLLWHRDILERFPDARSHPAVSFFRAWLEPRQQGHHGRGRVQRLLGRRGKPIHEL
jgi:hypothetical protein